MKLYTEEQVKQAILSFTTTMFVSADELLDELKLTPIELPSDEEIMYMSLPKKGGSHSSDYMEGFNKGAKWIINHIKQQDNA